MDRTSSVHAVSLRPIALYAGVIVLALGLCAPVWSRGADQGDSGWSYSGQRGSEHWGELAPAFDACSQGAVQSPIDIRSAQRIAYVPLMFQYRSQPMEAFNDGNGVKLMVPPGSELRIRGESYDLIEFHFHVPGEHRIEGVGAAAEIHLVHRGPRGERMIVAIPVRAGRRNNSILGRIVDRLPMHPGQRVRASRVGINPLFLLPSQRDYYIYDGSLEVPPCTEPVRWIVMAHPLEVEAEQVQRLARATGANARGVQPTNGRAVYLAARGR